MTQHPEWKAMAEEVRRLAEDVAAFGDGRWTRDVARQLPSEILAHAATLIENQGREIERKDGALTQVVSEVHDLEREIERYREAISEYVNAKGDFAIAAAFVRLQALQSPTQAPPEEPEPK